MNAQIGEQFITNTGQTLEYTGIGIFRDVKSGKKFDEDEVAKKLKYKIGSEEPLQSPALNFGEDKPVEKVGVSKQEQPLSTPSWES